MHLLSRAMRNAYMFAGLIILGSSALVAQEVAGKPSPHDVVIKNATVMTVTHGKIEHGSVYIKDGKIAAFGAAVNAPADATVIDATGKFVTPGLIDAHSHIALDDDVNEPTN